ncbi:hypothetical protein CQW23_35422 [Capsicum baccatum]|uniref:Uncharacterized protein n=1 Tax=Capsicum baccatum TaxID=33114 RepID=A0A2G2UVZ6_CAPBA|nr:hypothetical protein CQW23_35422 [Capsicum baccatum]
MKLHGSELKPIFYFWHFKRFERDYYKQPAYLKIEMLRSDPCEDIFSPKYYHRNDLALVTRVMELTSENIYGNVSTAIVKLPETNCVAVGSKYDLDSQLKTMSSNFLVLIMSQHEEKVMKERKRNNSHHVLMI